MSFPYKAPDEIKLITFDFTNEVATGATIDNPTLTVIAANDTTDPDDLDPDAELVIDGLMVKVLVGAGLDGGKYTLSCEVDASNGEHHRIDKILPVKEKAALVS